MALTALTGGDSLQSHKYPAKKTKESKSDSVAPESVVRKRTDTVDFKRSEVTRANQSAQLSAQGAEAQQLLGKIDFSA